MRQLSSERMPFFKRHQEHVWCQPTLRRPNAHLRKGAALEKHQACHKKLATMQPSSMVGTDAARPVLQHGVNRRCEPVASTFKVFVRLVTRTSKHRLNWLTLFLLELCWTVPYYRNATPFCRATGLKKRSNLCPALLPSSCREHRARQVP